MDRAYAKYQALGNSFIVCDEIQKSGRGAAFEGMAIRVCNSQSGIGADGLLIISPAGDSLRIDIYNSDGSWAEKSGNGIRIAAMHLLNRGLVQGTSCLLETGAGVSMVTFHRGTEKKRVVSASLGTPVFDAIQIPVKTSLKYFINQAVPCAGKTLLGSAISIGNPHLILFCETFDFDWQAIGKELEVSPLFPHRINIGFVIPRDDETIEVRDWERGAGPTPSSGTGAAAAVVLSAVRGFTGRRVNVQTQAGILRVHWDEKTDQIIIKGPVERVSLGNADF